MLSVLLALCLAGTPTPGAPTPTPSPAAPPALATFIRQPDQVRIYRADLDYVPSWEKRSKKKDTRPRNGMFVFSGKGAVLTAEEVQTLGMTWVPEEQLDRDNRPRCSFNPDIALRFEKAGTFVDVVACFSCEQLIIYDAKGKSLGGGRLDFRIMKRMARDAFPKEFGGK